MRKNQFHHQLFTFMAITVVMLSVVSYPISAASPSPSPSPVASASPEASPDTTQRLKERIDKVIEKRRDQVKGIIDQMSSQKRAFIGEVQRVTEKTVSIMTFQGEQEVITLDETIVLLKDNKRITVNDLAVGDWAIVMGYVNKESFLVKKIIISSVSLLPRSYETVVGNIKTVTTTQLVVTTRENQESKT
jgi:hypothetical protein